MQKQLMRLLGLAICSLLFFACGEKHLKVSPVPVAQNIKLDLLSPKSFGQSIELTQHAQISYQETTHELLFQVEITEESIVLVGLTPTGTRLFGLLYDGSNISISGIKSIIDKVKPDFLLADLQLTYWPLATLNENLSVGNRLIEKDNKRILKSEDSDIVIIGYSSEPKYVGSISFDHKQREYQLEIRTLEHHILKQE